MAIQSRDPCQQGDASATVLSRQKTDEKPSGAFVDGGHEAVDPAVLPSQGTLRMLLAGRALAGVEELLGVLLCHTTLPPCGDSREGQGHCSQDMGEVILGQLLKRQGDRPPMGSFTSMFVSRSHASRDRRRRRIASPASIESLEGRVLLSHIAIESGEPLLQLAAESNATQTYAHGGVDDEISTSYNYPIVRP